MKFLRKAGRRAVALCVVLLCVSGAWARKVEAATPVVSNVRASQRPGAGLVDIYYDVSDADGDPLYVTVEVSFNVGASYRNLSQTFSGPGYGRDITSGTDRHIIWDAGADLAPFLYRHVKVKVIADDGFAHVPAEMVYVPPGIFAMGDNYGEGVSIELPVHEVYVSGFYIDKFEVTKELWNRVQSWALSHGYDFDGPGEASDLDHPVHTVSWYDAVKWANARSESLGFRPCYYSDADHTIVYRQGHEDLTNAMVDWTADGFRLPTEAEWEKAARGGLEGHHYPWPSLGGSYSDHIDPSKANYADAHKVGTTPVGSYPANGYGIHDMAGNLWEWCWDWYSKNWYGQVGSVRPDTAGPESGSARMIRGGCWVISAMHCRVASRTSFTPTHRERHGGFRLVRGRL